MLNREMVKAWVSSHKSAKLENGAINYTLNINKGGDVVADESMATIAFTSQLELEDYGFFSDDYNLDDILERVYGHEKNGDPIFGKVVNDLFEQAIQYITGKDTMRRTNSTSWEKLFEIPCNTLDQSDIVSAMRAYTDFFDDMDDDELESFLYSEWCTICADGVIIWSA